jgi:hypothetical protein
MGDELMILSRHESRRIEPLEGALGDDGDAQSNDEEGQADNVPC